MMGTEKCPDRAGIFPDDKATKELLVEIWFEAFRVIEVATCWLDTNSLISYSAEELCFFFN